jgi:hypothetical protein
MADMMRMTTLATTCHVGTVVKPRRRVIVIGAVRGKRLMAIASGLFGFWMKAPINRYNQIEWYSPMTADLH